MLRGACGSYHTGCLCPSRNTPTHSLTHVHTYTLLHTAPPPTHTLNALVVRLPSPVAGPSLQRARTTAQGGAPSLAPHFRIPLH